MLSLVNIIISFERAFIIEQTSVQPFGPSFFRWVDCYIIEDNTLLGLGHPFPFQSINQGFKYS